MDKPTADPEVKAAAKVITASKDAIKSDSVGVLSNLGRSFYELGQYAEAIAPLEKALTIRPNQPDILLAVASAMVNSGKQLDAIGILEKLTSLSIVPTRAWKLLGYAYLYYPDDEPDKQEKLEKAIEASRKYISFQPDDYGAKLNLTCSYGQLGPEYADAKKMVIPLIKEVLENMPSWKQRIKNLTQPGQDFAQWTEVQEFMQLLN
jgi:tetratricopeptide (TPR) repeat protein